MTFLFIFLLTVAEAFAGASVGGGRSGRNDVGGQSGEGLVSVPFKFDCETGGLLFVNGSGGGVSNVTIDTYDSSGNYLFSVMPAVGVSEICWVDCDPLGSFQVNTAVPGSGAQEQLEGLDYSGTNVNCVSFWPFAYNGGNPAESGYSLAWDIRFAPLGRPSGPGVGDVMVLFLGGFYWGAGVAVIWAVVWWARKGLRGAHVE